ncbi:MAG: hypothetical protein WAQ99_10215 [Pyrinomonadaceae bacterium]
MKSLCRICVLSIVLGTSLFLSSASGQENTPGPRKFDDFGYMSHENYSARLDNIAIALQQEPNAQGYFIFYNGAKSLPGAPLRYIKRLQNYLVDTRGIDHSRIALLAGGRREEITVEFWISPPGSPAPIPDPAVSAEPTMKSYLYDSYSFDCTRLFQPKVKAPHYFDDCGYAGMSYEDQSARLDGFIKAISQTPGAKARLVVYSLPRDARRKVQTVMQEEKNYLMRKGGLQGSSIEVTSRKAPKYRSVELWVALPKTPGN